MTILYLPTIPPHPQNTNLVTVRNTMYFGVATLSNQDFERVTASYTLRDGDRVWHFLQDYAYLSLILMEAWRQINHYFPDSTLALEVATDPEASDTQLVAIIITTTSPDEAFERLEQFDKGWWINTVRQARGKLSITVEFA